MRPDKLFHFLRFGLQAKVVFITVLTGTLAAGILASFQVYQDRARILEITKDRLRRDGSIIQQEIIERGDKALEISKKTAITIRVFEFLDHTAAQRITASFEKKNPGFRISIVFPEDVFLKKPSAEYFSFPEAHPSIFSALKGNSLASIEKTSSGSFSIGAAAPMTLKNNVTWIVHTEWPFNPEYTAELKRLIDKDISIEFLPLSAGKPLTDLIEEEREKSSLEFFLNVNRPPVQNPFFSRTRKDTPSFLTYYLPLVNSQGTTLGILGIRLTRSVVFSNKGFIQNGAFILLFPLLMGTLFFLLTRKMIATPIIQLARVARTIATGNFTVPLPDIKAKDEIGELTSAIRDMRQKIENKTNELTSLNDTLLTQKKYLLKLNNELNQKNDYIASLVSTVSHELRTPMASIMGFTELLLNRKLPRTKQLNYIETIYLESIRLATILNDFLDIQKMESKDPGLILEEVTLKEVIDVVLVRFSDSIYPRHHFVKILPRDLPLIKGDKNRLVQCLMNLLSNAVKYSPKGGEIIIEVEKNEKELLTSVQDEGLGIPEEMQAKLFTKFFRVDSSDHREIGGTGLGLALCKDIIELHGGKIWVESKEGEGTRFTFSI
ncbi:MAG: HAMP domain-containing histidine kinase, partial [Nitrospirae bacterium]|nr:HAMP domain-containing histidine kinase [Nitrospirota bacterium]